MTEVEFAFLPEWEAKVLAGEKTATTRRTKHADPGDTFTAFGKKFRVVAVDRPTLQEVRALYWKDEGCASPAEFEEVWNRIHPRAGFRPMQRVFFHRWEPFDTVHPSAEPLFSPDGKSAVYFHTSEHMEEVADESVSLIFTSSPYGIGLRYWPANSSPAEGQKERPVTSWAEYERFFDGLKPVWRECVKKLAPGGFLIINMAPTHSESEFFPEEGSFMFPILDDLSHFIRKELGLLLKWKYYWLAQRSNNNSKGESQPVLGSYPIPLEGQVIRHAEEVLVFRKAGGRKLTEERMERRRKSKLTLAEWRDSFNQVITIVGARKEHAPSGDVHLAPFPDELAARFIRGYSCIGDVVLDPFLGTGTTVAEAIKLGRRGIGYEVQPEWRDLIAKKTQILAPSVGRPSKLSEFEDAHIESLGEKR